MKELKLDLLPERLRSAAGKESDNTQTASTKDVEPLPESERPRKDGPGGE